MKHLLVATDLSERSQVAVRRAGQLARLSGAPLTILHVVDDALPVEIIEAQIEHCRMWLAEHLPGEDGEPSPRLLVREGDPHEQITEVAEDLDVDLIVLGAHRRRRLFDSFQGTTAERVLRVSSRPVLVVHSDALEPYGRVYVASDLSAASAQSFRSARQLGLLSDRPVVVHVFVAAGQGKLRQAGLDPTSLIESERTDAAKRLASFLGELDMPDASFRTLLREGRVVAQIRHAVADGQPQLLVVGTRGLSGVKRAVLGSVTEAVLRSVTCDVLAVPGLSA